MKERPAHLHPENIYRGEMRNRENPIKEGGISDEE
jgi:hypothetical protein